MSGAVREVLGATRSSLARAGIPEERLAAELLLAATLGVTRTRLYATLTDPWPDERTDMLDALVQRRLRREPLAYVLGRREFYGREYTVGPGVLIPRPETEALVERALEVALSRFGRGPLAIADIGTGSGAIAISLAAHLPGVRVYATDMSAGALRIAACNARRHGVAERVVLLQGDLLDPLPAPVDLLVANLPYIPTADLPALAPEISHYEPPEALDGGPDGLSFVRRLLRQAPGRLQSCGAALLEVAPTQMRAAMGEARAAFPAARIEAARDLGGYARVLVVQT